jgi:hypothetical protein
MQKNLVALLPEDRPGTLAEACEALGRAGVNIDGCCEIEGYFHVLVEDVAAARRALEECGCDVGRETDVLVVDVDDRPGAAGEVLRRIADAGVNVAFLYLTTAGPRLVVGAEDVAQARAAVGGA